MSVLTARAYIAAAEADVWSRFTVATGYAAWYSAPCLEFATAVGGRVAWGTPERVFYDGVLERLAPGDGLTHTFQFQGFGFEEPATRVEIEVGAHGETVLVAIRHDCAEAPQTAAMIGPLGWLKALSRLKTLLETGTAMPWPAD